MKHADATFRNQQQPRDIFAAVPLAVSKRSA
jgi:hypothetical protein